MNLDLFGNVIVDDVQEVEVKAKKPSPFEFIKEFGDKRRLPSLDGYNAYIINHTLSMRKDLVFFANEMNKYHALPLEVQRDFYFHAIRKGNYHAKYAKATKDEEIPFIAEYYKCSMTRAKEYQRVLTNEQIKQIIEVVEQQKGGKSRKQ